METLYAALLVVWWLGCFSIVTIVRGAPLSSFSSSSSSSSSSHGEEHTPRHHSPPQHRSRKTDDLLTQLGGYEIVVPTLVDNKGEFLSYDVTHTPHTNKRKKRDVNSIPNPQDLLVYYSLSAYGMNFHFNLTLNQDLIAADYRAEFWDRHGVVYSYDGGTRHCHYQGHISKSRFSRVALSNCLGLHGVFATEDEEYFVEPLWDDTENLLSEGHFHVVYKRSAIKSKYNASHCGVTDSQSTVPHWWLPRAPWKYNEILKDHHEHIHPLDYNNNQDYNSPGYNHKQGHHKDKWREQGGRKKRSVSTERHVETLVVVDKMMVGYHGKQEIEPYVLTVMNIVANLYHDASIGNAINIMVTRLVLLTEDQPNLEISHHADRSLESFCRWQQSINPPAEGSDNSEDLGIAHHDNAVLITRYDICTYQNQPCGTLGLAPVAGMCEPDRSCSINEDIGLASSFTIAHEIGHNFGMHHDGAGNTCGTPGFEPAKIMAAQLTKNTEPFSWSTCSRDYITGFLDSGRGKCLENPPPEQDFIFPTEMPGQIHDADAQCKFQYGADSEMCKKEEVCRELWCVGLDKECVTNSIPASEGTTCSSLAFDGDGWCYKGDCVKFGWKPDPVDGGWGDWSEWGTCSRTCGGGVESSERSCVKPLPAHGGKYCIGERRRYRSCHIHDCPINSTDFRELQCGKFNEVVFRGKFYKWKPFAGVGQMKPCALNCLAVGYNFYTERAPKAIDGTRCYPDSLDMCINGECRHVGCDRILGSDAVEDHCRVCGGEGSTCDTIKGVFDEPLEKGGDSYQEVVKIPQGAVHIKVTETVFSRNYLALKSIPDEKYYINGAWTIDWPRKFEVANTVFHYERPTNKIETLTALGPTSEDLVVMILLQEKNLGISYQYNIPTSNSTYNGTEFVWQYAPWSECSATCAKGISQSVALCMRKEDRTVVKRKYCPPHLKPKDRIRYCNEEPCQARWEIGDWSECSKTCGGGIKTRSVKCTRQIDQTELEQLSHKECPTKRPTPRLHCNKDKCPPHWAMDDWSNCRPRCGPGHQTRNVYCVSAEGQYMPEEHCDAFKKPPKRRKCNAGACPVPSWVTGAWGECSAKCGKGQAMRSVACRTYAGDPSTECDVNIQPHNIQECDGACIPQTPEECKDVNKVAYCPLVLKFNFCGRDYFKQMCCKTCKDAGHI